MADIEIEIDGKPLTAKPNQMLIQVADEAGIYIPRFCYHKHLSVAANCRMCLVEVEKSPKALPACATPVMPGMKVFTKSPKTIAAQRAVMEFLLINHPLDCPVCDQGGECELQDLSMGYGASHSNYDECKRAQPDLDLGPLVATEMTRCIFCTRCVRFGTEVAGIREMGSTYRGEHTEISTFVQHAIESEVSGNIIDLCPVGALTSKPYRFTARAWELQQSPSISPHDCLGSNVNVHTLNGVIKRVVTRENSAINLTWISDRDRFGYEGLNHEERLLEPMIRCHEALKTTEWQHAFEVAANGIHNVISAHTADAVGALASPSATVEEHYLLQKIMRALGSSHVDHRLRESDTTDQASMPLFPGLGMTVAAIDASDCVMLIGSNLQKEQPIAAVRLRNAIKNGASVCVINPMDYDFNFAVANKAIVAPHQMVQVLAEVITAAGGQVAGFKADKAFAESAQAIAVQFKEKTAARIILGALAMHHEQAATIRELARQLATLTGATLGFLTDGANSAGGWIAGMVPHREVGGVAVEKAGLSAAEMIAKPRKAYVLLNVDPDKDMANSAAAIEAMKQADFVVALSLYRNPILEAHADVILPIAAFAETAGTFVNTSGVWQTFKGVAQPVGSSRPAWKVLRVLGNFLHVEGFDYESAEAITHEVTTLVEKALPCVPATVASQVSDVLAAKKPRLSRVGEIPIYATDSITRHSIPLQETQTIMQGDMSVVRMSMATASAQGLQEGDVVAVESVQAETSATAHKSVVVVVVDERVPVEAVWVAGGVDATSQLGKLFGEVTMTKVTHVS